MRKHTKFGKVQPKKTKPKKHFETARGEQAGRRNPKATVAHRGPQRYAKKLSADPL